MNRLNTNPARPSFKITVDKDKIPDNLDLIDRWFNGILHIENEDQLTSNDMLHQFIWRILLLFSTLLQTINIPVFHPGKILDIRYDSKTDKYLIILCPGGIESIHPKILEIILGHAARIVIHDLAQPPDSGSIQNLYKKIISGIVIPFKEKVLPFRKSTLPVLKEAYGLNIPFFHVEGGVYQLGQGSKSRFFDGSTTQFDSAMGSRLSRNKVISSNIIRDAGMPAPRHMLIHTEEQALDAAKRLGWPVVVKPFDGDRGEGVTVDIRNRGTLFKAIGLAKNVSGNDRVIVESQVEGVCHRVFITNSKLLYAVKRLPKSVIGDGETNIKGLIKKANETELSKPPWKRTEPFPMDELAVKTIRTAGFSIDDVAPKDALVPLRPIETTRWGGRDENVTDSIHPENIDIAIRATQLFRLNVAGIDIITPDIRIPWYENGAIINEVNFSPLFGIGDISKTAIKRFINEYIDGDGRIRITAFMGDKTAAMAAAKKQQKTKADQHINCFIAGDEISYTPQGKKMRFARSLLSNKLKALFMNSMVDEILLVVEDKTELENAIDINEVDDIIRVTPSSD